MKRSKCVFLRNALFFQIHRTIIIRLLLRCIRKSREALSILQKKHCAVTIIEYLKTPLTTSELKLLLKQLNMKPIDMIRTKESVFSELKLSISSTDAALIKAMSEHPILIERPIITDGTHAVIARPPENVLKLI